MEELLHPPDEPFEPLPEARQALLDRFKHYAVWHPRLMQVQTHLLDTIWEPADVVYMVVCGPSGVGKSKLPEVLTRRLNTPKSASNGHVRRLALLMNTRPPDGELFHRTNFYQQGLRLLGKTTIERHIQADPASPSPSTPPSKDGTTEQKSKPKGRVGEPSPRRDQVGTAQQEGETTYCSFSGPIQLEVGRLLKSTVEVVQCPTCGSVSKAKIKGRSVVITPHPPRKVRPVRNVTRWMEQGTEWTLVQKKE